MAKTVTKTKRVALPTRQIAAYGPATGVPALSLFRKAATPLVGKRVLHLSATSHGGGVAEILQSEVPLLRDLGVKAEWHVLGPPADFFAITKKMHNALQGEQRGLSAKEWTRYEAVSRELAEAIDPAEWDVIFVHDPQPALIPHFHPGATGTKWIWRCHLDSSNAYDPVRERLVEYLQPYDGGIFSVESFALAGFKPRHLAIIPPAIDPLSEKNLPMTQAEAAGILKAFPIDLRRPLVAQISRFDQWKDPLGVLEAWRLAKQQVPDLQLALVGNTADDDPQAPKIVKELAAAADQYDDLNILVDAASDRAVKAFQTASTVVLQKSLREGFGLTVTEALWAGTPVVASDVGGIPLQIQNGKNGYLVSSTSEAAERIAKLAGNRALAKRFGAAGRKLVKERFLLPRLVADDLQLAATILET